MMRPEELAMLVNGLDLAEARPRKNWLRRASGSIKHFRPFMCKKHSQLARCLTYNQTSP